jgi:hypothetical protein
MMQKVHGRVSASPPALPLHPAHHHWHTNLAGHDIPLHTRTRRPIRRLPSKVVSVMNAVGETGTTDRQGMTTSAALPIPESGAPGASPSADSSANQWLGHRPLAGRLLH